MLSKTQAASQGRFSGALWSHPHSHTSTCIHTGVRRRWRMVGMAEVRKTNVTCSCFCLGCPDFILIDWPILMFPAGTSRGWCRRFTMSLKPIWASKTLQGKGSEKVHHSPRSHLPPPPSLFLVLSPGHHWHALPHPRCVQIQQMLFLTSILVTTPFYYLFSCSQAPNVLFSEKPLNHHCLTRRRALQTCNSASVWWLWRDPVLKV